MIIEGKQKIWADYQKDIPDDHYFYVRSCIRQAFWPGSEVTFLDITRNKLGKDMYENPYHTTCGGIAYHSDTIPQETAMTIIARQFALMHESGYENYVCSCIPRSGATPRRWRLGMNIPSWRPRFGNISGIHVKRSSPSRNISPMPATLSISSGSTLRNR